jgi:chromosome segregation ATPase
MSDETNTPNLSELTEKLTQLSAQLEQAKAALTERDTKIKELEGATGGFKTANGQLTSKVTDLEAQLAAAQQTIQAQTGELTNWTTKFDQLNQAHTTLAGSKTGLDQELGLYKLIASDAKYHGLIGIIEGIKTDPDAEKQKQILDKLSGGFQAQANQTLDAYRAGATIPAGSTGQPGGSLPSDPKAAFVEYQSLLSATTPEAMSRRAALYEVITNAQFGENGKQQN